MKNLIYFIIPFLASCVSMRNRSDYLVDYRNNIFEGKCEEAQSRIPLEQDDTAYLRIYQGSIGYLAYISSLPVTVGVDILLMGRCRYGGCSSSKEPFIETVFPLSTYTYELTKDMRCPDTSYYIQKFLEIAECYEKRNNQKSIKYAFDELKFLHDSYESKLSCIKQRDAAAIDSTMSRIKRKITD